MTPQETVQELLAQLGRAGDSSSPAQAATWVRDELIDVWDAARKEARLAYIDWSDEKTTDTYVVFLAAQDRADAAQDALAEWGRQRRGR
jgi:hypothetical protein